MRELISTQSGYRFPFERIEEFSENGESLEVVIPDVVGAKIRSGKFLWERFRDFLPFNQMDATVSLGEGNTPLIPAGDRLCQRTGISHLVLKNETQNPTWSFKDRGSLACIFMAKELGEKITATISTGNMGNSVAAYAARSGVRAIIFVPTFTPQEKIKAMTIHGATVMKVAGQDYSKMKDAVLGLAGKLGLRVVSGNGPIRIEGYKLTAFEMFEQMEGKVPDFIAVPTSACGHIRGIFKGYKELQQAGLIHSLPRMVVVQAANNSPIVSAIKQKKEHVIPFTNFHTVAEAITSGNPIGGDEIIRKVYEYDWLAEYVTEDEILESQRELAAGGFFVEPAAATSLPAVRKLRTAGKIDENATVVLMLTGSGLKDMEVSRHHPSTVIETTAEKVEKEVCAILEKTS